MPCRPWRVSARYRLEPAGKTIPRLGGALSTYNKGRLAWGRPGYRPPGRVDVCSGNWANLIAARVAALLEHPDLQPASEQDNQQQDCRWLATLARQVSATGTMAHEQLGAVAATVVNVTAQRAGAPHAVTAAAAAIAGHVVTDVPLPFDSTVTSVVNAIRVAGTLVCTPDRLGHCECLADLARGLTQDVLRHVLKNGFALTSSRDRVDQVGRAGQ